MTDETEKIPEDQPEETEEKDQPEETEEKDLPDETEGKDQPEQTEKNEEIPTEVQKELQWEDLGNQEAQKPPEEAAVGDSKEVKNSTNCQAICNKENLDQPQKIEKTIEKTFADKNTENPPGPDIHGVNPMQENLCLVLHSIKNLQLEIKPIQEIQPNQVLLQMEVVGICGSDVHYYVDGKIGQFVVNAPMIMGHEASGTVVRCGTNVTQLKPGDRVAIEPQIPCRECDYCKTGNYHLCEKLFFCATPPDHGNLRRYYVHDADFCYKLPDNMDFEDGTLMEPLAVGVHVCTRLQITCGDYLLILGAGPIGLVTMLAGKAMGASKIIMTDIVDLKVKKALELGADYALNVSGMSEEDIIKSVLAKLDRAPNKTVDCCGNESAIRAGIKATKSGGKFAAVGMGTDDVLVPYTDFLVREVDLIGSFRYVNNYPTAIEMVANGKINPKPLITHRFKMEDSIKAFDMAANQEEHFIKIMIHVNPFGETPRITQHPSQLATVHPASIAAAESVTGTKSPKETVSTHSTEKIDSSDVAANEEATEKNSVEAEDNTQSVIKEEADEAVVSPPEETVLTDAVDAQPLTDAVADESKTEALEESNPEESVENE